MQTWIFVNKYKLTPGFSDLFMKEGGGIIVRLLKTYTFLRYMYGVYPAISDIRSWRWAYKNLSLIA